VNTANNTIKAKDALPGQWYYDQQYGFRLLCTHNHPPSQPAFVVNHAGTIYRDLEHRLTPLPDCTGWDWEPTPTYPPVPEGWRLIDKEKDYPKRADDKFWNRTSDTWEAVAYDLEFEPTDTYIRRIAPRYRPFANAEEFDPFSDRIIINISTGTRRRIDHWGDKGGNGMSWDMAFRKYTFLDGTPFGVKIDDEQREASQGS
jgi:hypothetical protein